MQVSHFLRSIGSSSKGRSQLSHWRLFSTKFTSASVEADVSKALKTVIEPVTGTKLHSLGCIQRLEVSKDGVVNLTLNQFVPGYVHKEELSKRCEEAVKSVSGISEVLFHWQEVQGSTRATTSTESGLNSVCHVIGVSSCKGGVGKTTVAVNLACALAQRGLEVGILDADVYGPSLPTLLQPVDHAVRRSPNNPKFVLPLQVKDVPNLSMLSFGHVNPNAGAPGAGGKEAAIMRGPLASKVLNQLLLATDWGEMDYLIIDMPPGTGDIQITLTQSVQMSGAVVVTTPHRLALVDAAKGVAMFDQVNVPVISVVENMAYFVCRHGEKYFPFGCGGKEKLLAELSKQASTKGGNNQETESHGWPYHQVPLTMEGSGLQMDESSSPNYVSLPAVISAPNSETASTYKSLADSVIDQLFKQQTEASMIPAALVDKDGRGLRLCYFGSVDSSESRIPVEALKVVHPRTGMAQADIKVPSNLKIERIELKGLYGIGVSWSDGQVDIYPYDVLKGLAQDYKVASK